MIHDNRESWLNGVAAGMAPLFEALGAPLPDRVRVAIGFTSAGRRSRAIGECWDNRRSADGHFEIFIRPDLAHAPDAMPAQIAAILAHELVHAAVGIKAGHGKSFKRVALGLGLVGPMRATTPGETFLATIAPILAADRAQEAGGADAQVRVPDVRLHRQDRAQMAGDGRGAALPNPRSWRDASRPAGRGRGGRLSVPTRSYTRKHPKTSRRRLVSTRGRVRMWRARPEASNVATCVFGATCAY
jgi:hypothetical protein